MVKATFGLDENIAAALTYVLGVLTGIIFFLIEKENKTVRFHAIQSIIIFLPLMVVMMIVSFIPFINLLLPLVGLVILVLWLVLIIKAYQGEKFTIPVVGDLAESYV